MKKSILLFLLMILPIPVTAQDSSDNPDGSAAPSVSENEISPVYHTIVLENFEASVFSKKNLLLPSALHDKSNLQIADNFPSPENNSKKYLMLTLFSNHHDIATIIPSETIKISKYCKSISLWTYGKNSPGMLSIFLKDITGEQHRLTMGRLDFHGWKKLTTVLPSNVAQMDAYLHQNTYLTLQKITYHPGTTELTPRFSFIYIDDITAVVRNKYLEKGSNGW